MLIYRLDAKVPPKRISTPDGICVIVTTFKEALSYFSLWAENWGVWNAIRIHLKVLRGRRIIYFSVINDSRIVQSGWANVGFCRQYPVEKDSIVLGNLYTEQTFRNVGFATSAKSQVLAFLFGRGYRRFYAGTTTANRAAQRTSEKLGFELIADQKEDDKGGDHDHPPF